MKVLFISKSGDGLGLAHYMKIQGHEILLWIEEDKDFEYAGLGMFKRLKTWQSGVLEADLILADMVGFGKFESFVKKKPYLCINQGADDLELDRSGQMEIMRRLKIGLPKTSSFDSPRAAESILEIWPSKSPGFVIKPSGNLNTGKTLVCRDPKTYKWALSTYSGSQPLVIQEIVEGVEISTEGWFDGRQFIPSMWNHTFEEKRFLEHSLGPNTGCMGNIVILANENSLLVRAVKKFAPILQNFGYRGPFDLNAIVNETGIYALEVTPRFGYDAVETLATMAEGDFTEQLALFAKGALLEANFRASVGAAVRLHVPPYPFDKANKDDRGRPIQLPKDANKEDDLGFYLLTDAYYDVNIGDKSIFAWAASDGAVAKVTHIGESLEDAISKVYEKVSAFRMLDVGYRRDIGRRVYDEVLSLQKLGVI